MKKITRFSIFGCLFSIFLIIVKSNQTSKILAVSALIIFIYMFLGTYKKDDFDVK